MIDLLSAPFGVDKPLVLVVDDDPDINRLLQVRLRNVGFEVRSAPDGETALDFIAQRTPDLILLDISMPGIGGLEVLKRIRDEGLDVAVVMTTAFGSETVAIDALRRGADDYLRKPFEPGELRAVVDRTMSRLTLRRQNDHLRKQLDAELLRASEIQRSLLPARNPDVAGYDIATCCLPAREVGGDFYNWCRASDDSLAFVLADVMGKGMPAALLMATVRASLRPAMQMHGPAAAVNVIAETLEEDLARTRSFVAMFVGDLDTRRHFVSYVDAGHGLAILVKRDGGHEMLQGTDVPVGIFPDTRYRAQEAALSPGDALVIYSDGLHDLLEGRGVETLVSQVRRASSASEAVSSLIDLARSSGGWSDDITIMVIRRLEDDPAA